MFDLVICCNHVALAKTRMTSIVEVESESNASLETDATEVAESGALCVPFILLTNRHAGNDPPPNA